MVTTMLMLETYQYKYNLGTAPNGFENDIQRGTKL
jgi:hypothetical protein